MLRSLGAHSQILALDVDAAWDRFEVHTVVAAEDFRVAGVALDLTAAAVNNLDSTQGAALMCQPLSRDNVQFGVEAMSEVIAESLGLERDVTAQVMVENI